MVLLRRDHLFLSISAYLYPSPPSSYYKEKEVNKEMDEDGNGILPIPDSGYTTSGEKPSLLYCHWELTSTLVVTVAVQSVSPCWLFQW